MSDVREELPEDLEPRLEPAPPDESTADWPTLEESPADSPPPESPSIAPAFAEECGRAIEALGDRLSQRLDAIQTVLEREARAEATRERVVDRLHAELQEYKQDLLLKVQRPIFIDLIQLHDDIGKMIEARPPYEDDADRTAAVVFPLYVQASERAPGKHELLFWAGLGTAHAGDLDAGVAQVQAAIAIQPAWRELLARLPPDMAPSAPAVRARLE